MIIKLDSPEAKRCAIESIKILSTDPVYCCEIKKFVKKRTPNQNALMWSGPLNDIAEQVFLNGRRYSCDMWHHKFKCDYLPDENQMSRDELALRVTNPDEYKKWDCSPDGERLINGSTTELTTFGMSEYLDQIYAIGADLEVRFSADIRMVERNK